ncbi:MAG TPA: serine hydrolase [Thermoanaerobaculia bacterium]|jgi:CubicO group peptidase (beta-lactamase class C family)|nr:serine hydrolase [Thermoanaerobaculia bacterium]
MRRLPCLLFLCFRCACAGAQAAEPPPFAVEAASRAPTLGHGAIATAERRGGRWELALAGEAFAAGHPVVAPEKVLFEIGSISKVFTGLLLADAVVDGKLALADTLAQRLPVKFEHPETGAVTLRQLATHTSCLTRLPDNMTRADTADPYALYDDRALFEYLATAQLDGRPPCAPAYSNLAFGVLGVVLERAYGKPWETLVHEKIAGPLGMADTVQHLSPEQRARLADPWDGKQPAHEWTFDAMAGCGALRSTTADMSKFAEALLAGAKGPLAKAWPLLAGDYVEMPAIGGKVGLALEHVTFDSRDGFGDSYGHEGGTGGYRSIVEVWPANGRAVVVLASNAVALPLAWLAVWRTSGEERVARQEVALPLATLGDYVGMYSIDKQLRFTILRRGDGLVARLTGQPFFVIFPSAKDEFFYKVVDAQLSFHRNAAGAVDLLTLHQNGRDLPAKRDPSPAPRIEFPNAAALAGYAGEYDFGQFQPGAKLTVTVSADTLFVQLTGQPASPVFCVARDRFEYDVVAAAVTFERDGTGKVVAMTLHQNGMDMRAPRR